MKKIFFLKKKCPGAGSDLKCSYKELSLIDLFTHLNQSIVLLIANMVKQKDLEWIFPYDWKIHQEDC